MHTATQFKHIPVKNRTLKTHLAYGLTCTKEAIGPCKPSVKGSIPFGSTIWFFTIFSALDKVIKKIIAKSGANLKISFAATINTRYIPACSG